MATVKTTNAFPTRTEDQEKPLKVTLYDSAGTALTTPLSTKLVDSSGNALDATISGQTALKTFIYGQPDNNIAGSVPVLDGGNTTSTLLGIGGVFTGTWNNIMGMYAAVQVSCFVNVAGFGAPNTAALEIQWSSDGVTFDGDLYLLTIGSSIDGNPSRVTLAVEDNYFRVVLTNGGYTMVGGGNYLRLTTVLHPVMPGSVVRGSGQFVVGGDGSGAIGNSLTIGGDDGSGNLTTYQAGTTGEFPVFGRGTTITGTYVVTAERGGATGTLTNVSVAASSTTLAASATGRRGVKVHNDSSEILYLKYGSSASTTSFTNLIWPGEFWTMETTAFYTGIVTGIAGVATGTWRVTTW